MFGTFILGLLAGWGAPYAEPRIKDFLQGVLLDDVPVAPREMSLLSFAACLLGAALVSAVLASSQALPLVFGAAVGVFGPRVIDKWKSSRTPDYDS